MKNFSHILLLSLCAALSFLLFCAAPSTAPGPSKPPAPLSVSATGGSMSSILVSWIGILNATSYKVFKSAVDTGTFRVVDTVTGTTYSDTGLTPGSVFYYKVSALNSLGESGQSSAVTASTAVPGHVSAKCTLQTCIVVTWAPVTGAASYNVYRDTSDTGTFLFGRTMTTDTLVDSGLAAGTRYYYRIKAVNNNGASGLSFTKNAITLSAIPVGAGATAVSSSRIVITWPLVTGAALYKIYRNTVDTGAFTLADSVSADTFSDTNSAGGTTYYYKISAVNGSGESGLSAPCSTLTFPGVPSGVSAAGDSSLGIMVTWQPLNGAVSYNVYRSTVDTGEYSAVGSTAADTFSDTGLVAGATYYYKVSGLNTSGESGKSEPVPATTLVTGFIQFEGPEIVMAAACKREMEIFIR